MIGSATVTVTYPPSGVGITVSIAINHTTGAGVINPAHRRTVNINGSVIYIVAARAANIADVINLHPVTRYTLNINPARTTHIPAVIAVVKVVYKNCTAKKARKPCPWHIIIVYNRAVNVHLRSKSPVIVRWLVGVIIGVTQASIGAKRSPAVVIIATAPVNPGGSPFVIGYPLPAVIIIKFPTTVMERCPTPFIVRHPGIAIIGHYPVSIGSIRFKVLVNIGHPNGSVIGVIDPGTIRRKLIVKILKGNFFILRGSFLRHCHGA